MPAKGEMPSETRSDLHIALPKGGTLVPYNNIISRTDAAATIPEEVSREVKLAAESSAALSLFRRVNMGSKTSTLPVLSELAQAYFVNGDTSLKQTTELA